MPSDIPQPIKTDVSFCLIRGRAKLPPSVYISHVMTRLSALYGLSRDRSLYDRWAAEDVTARHAAAALEMCERFQPGEGRRLARQLLEHWSFPRRLRGSRRCASPRRWCYNDRDRRRGALTAWEGMMRYRVELTIGHEKRNSVHGRRSARCAR